MHFDTVVGTKTSLSLPNEDFGVIDKRRTPDFRMTFQWFVPQLEYFPSRTGVLLLFLFQNHLVNMKLDNFTPPKRGFWKDDKRRNPDFEGSTFQGCEY
jgi:hypothetical protein